MNVHKCMITNESLTGLWHNQLWLFAASSLCLGDLSNYTATSTKQEGLIDSARSSWWLLQPPLPVAPLSSSHPHRPLVFSLQRASDSCKTLYHKADPTVCCPTLCLLLPIPPSMVFPLHPFAPLTASQTHSATAMQLSAADAAELITVSFISRLAAQRDLGIDEMPADWWLLNRLLFTPMTQLRGWREERRREWEEEV